MSRWFETTEAIKQIESADERMTEMQEEREDERKRRIKAEARVAELEAQLQKTRNSWTVQQDLLQDACNAHAQASRDRDHRHEIGAVPVPVKPSDCIVRKLFNDIWVADGKPF